MAQTIEKRTIRELSYSSQGQLGSDGDGVKLTRFIGNKDFNMLDPFLLLDLFCAIRNHINIQAQTHSHTDTMHTCLLAPCPFLTRPCFFLPCGDSFITAG